MPRGISAKLYLPGAVSALIGSWMARPSQWAHYCTTGGARYSYTIGIILLFTYHFQYSVHLLSVADGCCGYLGVLSLPQAAPDCADTGGWTMPVSAVLPVLYHCPVKQMICTLALMGALCGAGQGDHLHLQPHFGLSEAVIPEGLFRYCPEFHPFSLLQHKLWLILVTTALVFSCLKSHFHHLTGHRMQLWSSCWWLFSTWSSCSAVLHSPGCTHSQNRVFSRQLRRGFLWCPISALSLCPFLPWGCFVALVILRHLTMV